MNNANQHIKFIDHIRGIAILAVFFGHALVAARYMYIHSSLFHYDLVLRADIIGKITRILVAILSKGWVGVPIFFVVSGFCIHLSFERSRFKSWKEYVIKRFFRIYPPYLLALLFFGLIFPYSRLHFGTTHHEPYVARIACWSLLEHIFMAHHFGGNRKRYKSSLLEHSSRG